MDGGSYNHGMFWCVICIFNIEIMTQYSLTFNVYNSRVLQTNLRLCRSGNHLVAIHHTKNPHFLALVDQKLHIGSRLSCKYMHRCCTVPKKCSRTADNGFSLRFNSILQYPSQQISLTIFIYISGRHPDSCQWTWPLPYDIPCTV